MLVSPLCPLSLSPDCSFTCHYRCRALVRLDCSGPLGTGDEDDGTEQELEKDTNVVGDVGRTGRGGQNPGRAVPCRAVLCQGVLCCAVPCCAKPCHAKVR